MCTFEITPTGLLRGVGGRDGFVWVIEDKGQPRHYIVLRECDVFKSLEKAEKRASKLARKGWRKE